MRFISLLLILFSTTSFAKGEKCQYITNDIRMCVYNTIDSTSTDVIYYLHGRGGRAESWADSDARSWPEKLRKEWQAMGAQAPKVVTISFGPMWLLADKNPSRLSGLLEVMVDRVLPVTEQYIGGTKGRRMILGDSMGGFNSIQLALKTDLFERAAILCAPMASGVDAFSPQPEIEAWIRKSAAFAYYGESKSQPIFQSVSEMLFAVQQVWQNRANWQSADPLKLAATVDKSSAPLEMYVNAGFYDRFALYEGNLEFVKILLGRKGVSVEWHPEWGDHCTIDIPSLARFLVK
jgi:pimeloyl-ACP methyl ester carboxylesterase